MKSLQNEKYSFNPKTDTCLKDPLPALKKQLSELKKKRSEDIQNEELKSNIYRLEIEITKIEIESIRFNYIKELPQLNLDEKIQSKKNQLEIKEKDLKKISEECGVISYDQFVNEQAEVRCEAEIKELQDALERQAQLPKGVEILSILRGEKEGVLTMQDAQLICGMVNTTISREIYRGIADAQADLGHAKLKDALYHSDWRGIRVGGHGHWWVYIRNPDGQTVDEINDNQIYYKKMTIDQLFNQYSNSNEWKHSQITFYDGIKS